MYTAEQIEALLSDDCLCRTDFKEEFFRYLILNSLINIGNAIADIPGGGGGGGTPESLSEIDPIGLSSDAFGSIAVPVYDVAPTFINTGTLSSLTIYNTLDVDIFDS